MCESIAQYETDLCVYVCVCMCMSVCMNRRYFEYYKMRALVSLYLVSGKSSVVVLFVCLFVCLLVCLFVCLFVFCCVRPVLMLTHHVDLDEQMHPPQPVCHISDQSLGQSIPPLHVREGVLFCEYLPNRALGSHMLVVVVFVCLCVCLSLHS